MNLVNSISVIIPIVDELESLPGQLQLLTNQTIMPQEIIFVCAGEIAPIEKSLKEYNLKKKGLKYKVIYNKDGMPGGNRNIGISAASSDWIAFIDAGIYPELNWIESLVKCINKHNVDGVFGTCRFDGNNILEKAVCSLSYGCNIVLPVLPSSLFHKNIFSKVGYFSNTLRSGEDILWIRSFENVYGKRVICENALVNYTHHPSSLIEICQKWFLYEKNAVAIGVNKIQQKLLLFFFLAIIITTFFSFTWGIILFLTYIIIRGFIDPIRRSKSIFWYKEKPIAILIPFVICMLIDFSKLSGFIIASLKKVK